MVKSEQCHNSEKNDDTHDVTDQSKIKIENEFKDKNIPFTCWHPPNNVTETNRGDLVPDTIIPNTHKQGTVKTFNAIVSNSFDSNSNVGGHQDQFSHEVANQYRCRLCGFRTKFRSNLKMHMECHDFPRKPYKCSQCFKRYKDFNDLQRHLKTHNDRFKFHCVGCFHGFNTKYNQIKHEMKCKRRRYECYICKECSTNSQINIEIHMRKHTGERPYKCSLCSKRYAYLSDLQTHGSIHTDFTSYKGTKK